VVQQMYSARSEQATQLIDSLSEGTMSSYKGYYTLNDLHFLLDHAQFDNRTIPIYLIYYFVLDIELLTKLPKLSKVFKGEFKGILSNESANIIEIVHKMEN
jgi:hypothetical protein